MSKIKVNEIEKASGSGITIPTGTSFTVTDGIAVAGGGTGLTSFTAGDLLYATGSTTLAKLPKGTAAQQLAMNAGATAPEWITAGGGIVSSGTFANGRNFGTYSWNDQTSTSSTSFVDMNGSSWNVGAGALTANKTCYISYSVMSYNQDWLHDAIALQVSTDDGSNWDYVNSNSEDVHDGDHESSSAASAAGRRTGFHIISMSSGQTPRFRFKVKIYSGSNGSKINYDAGNNGTVKSYYQAWWV